MVVFNAAVHELREEGALVFVRGGDGAAVEAGWDVYPVPAELRTQPSKNHCVVSMVIAMLRGRPMVHMSSMGRGAAGAHAREHFGDHLGKRQSQESCAYGCVYRVFVAVRFSACCGIHLLPRILCGSIGSQMLRVPM